MERSDCIVYRQYMSVVSTAMGDILPWVVLLGDSLPIVIHSFSFIVNETQDFKCGIFRHSMAEL